jgi:hypothetical protein
MRMIRLKYLPSLAVLIKNGVEAALVELRPLVSGKSGIAERLASFNRFLERFDNALTNAAETTLPL